MKSGDLNREFFLGFIKLHILYHAAEEPVCGVDLVEELKQHGYVIGPGTLYPTLHALERAGYLVRHHRTVSGRQRKYYTATESGQAALEEGKERARELLQEILGEQP